MNANELADQLEQQETIASMTTLRKIATMLRQQQAKIEALEANPVKELTDEEIRHIQAICHLKDVGYDNFIMRFARAILRKASEK